MDNHKKHSLGRRAYFLFLSKRIKLAIFFFALTAAVWFGERWLSPEYVPWGDYASKILLLLSGTYFFLILVWTYLEYHYFTYMFTEEAFVMTSGYMMRDEITALYHQIQNVNIHRTPSDRLVGVSQIVIYMAGSDRGTSHNHIILPALGKKKAKMVQGELLKRARGHVRPAQDSDGRDEMI